MTRNHAADDRTVQDDRAELDADPGEGSPLAEGPGAPLAQDDAAVAEEPVTTHVLLGGAPIPITTENSRAGSPGATLTTPEDRPLGD